MGLPRRALIAGAGITGLSTAYFLAKKGISSIVVEKRNNIGGMAVPVDLGGVKMWQGVHLLHASSKENRALVEELAGLMRPDCLVVRPSAKVFYGGDYLSYPLMLQELVARFGFWVLLASGFHGFWFALRKNALNQAFDSFEDVARSAFGDRVYRMFFADYTKKLLGVGGKEIDAEWALKRLPLPGFQRLIEGLLPWAGFRGLSAHDMIGEVQFVGEEGMTSLATGLVQACKEKLRLELRCKVKEVHWGENGVEGVVVQREDGGQEEFSDVFVVSTMPLPELLRCLVPRPPEDVMEVSSRLGFRGVTFVGLAFEKRPSLKADWVYIQDEAFIFNRVGDISRFTNNPLLVAEVSEERARKCEGNLVEKVLCDLSKLPGLEKLGDPSWAGITSENFAYPLWHKGFRQDLKRIFAFIGSIKGLYSIGRQGAFEYLNMDECARMALDLVSKVIDE
jgi:protoporphyrinogen oxidase